MLTRLTIHNYALISDLDISFGPGFSVLTGETGAGKSIILGALALLMGSRADTSVITEGEQHCVIEGEFDIADYHLEAFFEENELDFSPQCIIRRELSQSGKSRSFINDTPVTLAILKPLAAKLIDIHSQHENLLLSDDSFCLSVVDTLASNASLRDTYTAAYHVWLSSEKALVDLRKEAADAKKNEDFILYQYEQLKDACLQEGEYASLEEEHQRLSHAEEILDSLQEALSRLRTEEGEGAEQALRQAHRSMERIHTYLPAEDNLCGRLESACLEIADIADTTERLLADQGADPHRLETIEERMGELSALFRKFGTDDETELIRQRDQYGEQLEKRDSYDFEIGKLEKQVAADLATLKKAADALTRSRKGVESRLKQSLEQMLTSLGIAHAVIGLRIEPLPEFSENGQDMATILFAANLGQSPRPVSEVASGGEMARIMLSIKALLADTQGLPTIIFDEVDTGVSGEVASHMGRIMKQIAHGRQILSITHLPQIAAMGEAHYKVYKEDSATRTETHIRRLSDDERPDEIAALLSGTQITPEAVSAAKRLLSNG